MRNLDLNASIRTEKSNLIRKRGAIPAVVYGQGIEPLIIEVDKKVVSSLFSHGANKNVLISLNVKSNGKSETIPVLAHDFQVDPITDQIIHVDFLKVNMEEEIKTKVQIEFSGIPAGVKLEGGILVHSLRQLEIKCLPNNIPEKIIVDVSDLKVGQSLHVSNIIPPQGVTIITPKDETVVIVTSPTEEEAPVAETAAAMEVGAVQEATTGEAGEEKSPTEQKSTADSKAKAAPVDDSKTKAQQKPQK